MPNLEDLQTELVEIVAIVDGAFRDLENAETCETINDFKANLKSAKEMLRNAIVEIENLEGEI